MNLTLESDDGRASIRRTPWDERVLGCPTAEILELQSETSAGVDEVLRMVLHWAKDEHIGYLNGRFAQDRAIKAALERNGFANVETTLDMVGRPPKTLPRVPSSMAVTLEPMRPAEVPTAQQIAFEAFHHGRMLEDPLVPESAARQRTANWVADLASQGRAFGAHAGDRMVGFHCDSSHGSSADLILTGVGSQDSAFALAVWSAALEKLRASGVTRIRTTVSAANTAVINLYVTLGFKIHQTWFGFRRFEPF